MCGSIFRFLSGLIFILFTWSQTNAQYLHPDSLMSRVEELGNYLLYRNHDTSYIQNHGDKFSVKLIGVNKFNYFIARDSKNDASIKFRPDRRLNLGVGLSYKWFAFDLAFNVGITEDSDFINSKYVDISGTIFSSKQFISASYQYYYGYQMSKIKGVEPEEIPNSSIRDDIRTIHFGLQYFFAFNYDKFSLKSSFIHNEIQKKSAGSFVLGAGFGLYTISADSSIVPSSIQPNFDEAMHLTELNVTKASVGFGYMYTLILQKHFYVTLSLIPGLGLNLGDYKTEFRKPYDTHLFIGLKTMNSIGYNSERMFGGIQFSSNFFRTSVEKKLNVHTGHGKAKIFIGYRFAGRKRK